MSADAYRCFRCGSSDVCEHDREHDWKPATPYRSPGLPVEGLITCAKCHVARRVPWVGPDPGSATMGPFGQWDGTSDCRDVRDAREKAEEFHRVKAAENRARVRDFFSAYPEGFYWVRYAQSSSPGVPRPAFVMFLNHGLELFSSFPASEHSGAAGLFSVEVLGPCPIPEEVLQKLSVEVVMLS